MQGYNATVLAYGQTGSGKTHTMAGGQGIHGIVEEGKATVTPRLAEGRTLIIRPGPYPGVTPRVIRHIFALAEALRKKEKPGEKTQVLAGP